MAIRQKYVDPTPEEIRQRCLEIQAEWCDEVRAQRETVRQRKELAAGNAPDAEARNKVD